MVVMEIYIHAGNTLLKPGPCLFDEMLLILYLSVWTLILSVTFSKASFRYDMDVGGQATHTVLCVVVLLRASLPLRLIANECVIGVTEVVMLLISIQDKITEMKFVKEALG